MYYLFFPLVHIDVFALWGLLVSSVLFLTPWKNLAKKMMVVSSIPLIIISLTPLPQKALHTLEQRFPVPLLPKHIDGLILLGGTFALQESDSRSFPVHNLAASRLFDFIALMRRYPHAKVLFSGTPLEAKFTLDIMEQHGIDTTRVFFDDKASDTRDNVKNLMESVKIKSEEKWVLVTSAFHIPRSVGLFRGISWKVIPYPVDFHTPLTAPTRNYAYVWSRQNFLAWATAAKEGAGLVNNWLDKLSPELFPAPETSSVSTGES